MERATVPTELCSAPTIDLPAFDLDWDLNSENAEIGDRPPKHSLLDFVKQADELIRQRPSRKRPVTPEQMERDRDRKRVSRQRNRELAVAVRSLTTDQSISDDVDGESDGINAANTALTSEDQEALERKRDDNRLRKRVERLRKRLGALYEPNVNVTPFNPDSTTTSASSAHIGATDRFVPKNGESTIPKRRSRKRSDLPAEKLEALRQADRQRKQRRREKISLDEDARELEAMRKREYRARQKALLESQETSSPSSIVQHASGAICSFVETGPLCLLDLLPKQANT